jgi:hypothetical protein
LTMCQVSASPILSDTELPDRAVEPDG